MRTPPRKRIPSVSDAWKKMAGPYTPLPLAEVHRRGETRQYFLRNTLLAPYKKPCVPGAALPPKAHDLLSRLKIADAYLGVALALAQRSLPGSEVGPVFSPEAPVPVDDRRERFARWWENGLCEPCLVVALGVDTSETSWYYSLTDLSLLHPRDGALEHFDTRELIPAACAATHYNEAVQGLFDLGWVVFPCILEGGELGLEARGLPDGAVVLDI